MFCHHTALPGRQLPSFQRFPSLSDPVTRPTGHSPPPLGSSLPPRPRGRYTCDHVHTSNFRFSYPNCFVRVRAATYISLLPTCVCLSRLHVARYMLHCIQVRLTYIHIYIYKYICNTREDRVYGIGGSTEKHAATYKYVYAYTYISSSSPPPPFYAPAMRLRCA